MDNLFSLTSIIRNENSAGKHIYAAFLDIQKAFDWVDRDLLKYKLLSIGINGKIFNAIDQLYSKTVSRVKLNQFKTNWFEVNSGVRQGDSLSPTLFNIYINDLIIDLNSMDLGVDINGRRVCCLLYADDIVIFCNTESDLQKLLDRAHRWCYKWKMQINHEKSNIVHFRRKRVNRSSRRFKFGSKKLSVVNSYKYLGFLLDEHLYFVQGVDVLSSSAGRALSTVIAKFKHLRNVGFTTYTKLYNCCVKLILGLSSAVWKDKKYIEHIKVFNRAIRYFLGLPRTAPIVGMCGDMG